LLHWSAFDHQSDYDFLQYPHHGPRTKRLASGVEAIIAQAIDDHCAKRTRPGLRSLVSEVARRCQATELAIPFVKTIKPRVRAAAARDGAPMDALTTAIVLPLFEMTP
jgi:hypothetical protein